MFVYYGSAEMVEFIVSLQYNDNNYGFYCSECRQVVRYVDERSVCDTTTTTTTTTLYSGLGSPLSPHHNLNLHDNSNTLNCTYVCDPIRLVAL